MIDAIIAQLVSNEKNRFHKRRKQRFFHGWNQLVSDELFLLCIGGKCDIITEIPTAV